MPLPGFNESTVEEAALSWFDELGYRIGHGPEIAPGEPAAERGVAEQATKVRRAGLATEQGHDVSNLSS